MSFRGDDQRRYGHVPPVQYPVAARGQAQARDHHQQQQQQQQQQSAYDIDRRASFNDGDDAAYYDRAPDRSPAFANAAPAPSGDELFLTNPPGSQPSAARPSYGNTSNALSGYQHQYQDNVPSTPTHYNPQNFPQTFAGFGRSQSTTTLPYHHQPPTRYASNASSYTPSQPTNYTPQAYNPAAYANSPSAIPQRQTTYSGYNNYGQNYHTGAASQSPGYASNNSGHGSAYVPAAPSPALSSGFDQPLQSLPLGPHTSLYDQSYNQYTAMANGTDSAAAPYPNSSQPPYPTSAQIPVGPYYTANDHNPMYDRGSRSNSQTSPVPPPSAQPQGSPGLQRHPTNAPLPSRPGDGSQWTGGGQDDGADEQIKQDSIMEDIEGVLGGSNQRYHQLPDPANGRYSGDEDGGQQLQRFDSGATTIPSSASRTTSGRTQTVYDDDDDDEDDDIGAAGVLAMQQAELDDQRFGSSAFFTDMPAMPAMPAMPIPPSHSNTLPPPPEEQAQSSDSDFGGQMDLGMFSGGYPGTLAYGNGLDTPQASSQDAVTRPLPTPGQFNRAYDTGESVPAFRSAEIDYGGTGGLQAPTAHRLSFDEGDERVSLHSRQSGTESPAKDDYQELFYHPGLSSRPLPAIPDPGSDSSSMLSVQNNNRQSYQHVYSRSADSRFVQPENPEAYYTSAGHQLQQPERSISLSGHTQTPQVQTPARSRTDAAEERRKLARYHHHTPSQSQVLNEYEPGAGTLAPFDGITLPSGRKKKFVPSKLNAGDFRRCPEPWALSGLEAWVREMAEGELDLKSKAVEEALINLFTGKIPMMNVADAEVLSSHVAELMLEKGVLVPEEEWVKFGSGHISGVLWQLTGSGCYAPKVHDEEIGGRCYSYHCTRTLKKVDLDDLIPQNTKAADEWHVFYGLKREDWESKPKKEVDRQNILHEIVTGEENYIKQLDVFRLYYRDQLRVMNPPILKPDKREKFLEAVFGKLDTVSDINKDNLFAQLKYRQQEQGPWITGFSDLFREWIRKAKSIYIEYASAYPRAVYMVRRESERNILFKRFLDDMQKHKFASKHDWTHYLIVPIQRLQRYILLLESVDHKMIDDSEEKSNLGRAIAEIKLVATECDSKVAEMNKRVEMMDLNRMLVLRPGFQSVLNLDHLGRELIHQGDMQRMGSKGVRWVDTHALLFDHYMILAKTVNSRDGKGEKKYDVSREVCEFLLVLFVLPMLTTIAYPHATLVPREYA